MPLPWYAFSNENEWQPGSASHSAATFAAQFEVQLTFGNVLQAPQVWPELGVGPEQVSPLHL
jgi:hypothetical protein